MTQELTSQNKNAQLLEKLILNADISQLTPEQKVSYYTQFCEKLGLNPLTQPFKILKLQGKETLYVTKDGTEQLRKINDVSIIELTTQLTQGVYIVTAKAKDKNGKIDASTGVVAIEGLKGDALANALMKAETKAKRRVTLSISGLGATDESEIDSIPGARTEDIPHEDVTKTGSAQKPTVTDAFLIKAIVRINKGEVDLAQKILDTYELAENQIAVLSSATEAAMEAHKQKEAEANQ